MKNDNLRLIAIVGITAILCTGITSLVFLGIINKALKELDNEDNNKPFSVITKSTSKTSSTETTHSEYTSGTIIATGPIYGTHVATRPTSNVTNGSSKKTTESTTLVIGPEHINEDKPGANCGTTRIAWGNVLYTIENKTLYVYINNYASRYRTSVTDVNCISVTRVPKSSFANVSILKDGKEVKTLYYSEFNDMTVKTLEEKLGKLTEDKFKD